MTPPQSSDQNPSKDDCGRPVAALFVAKDGPYIGVPGVDPWTVERDARTYAGAWPVVAHPPCERWGRYAKGGPNPKARRFEIGADGGCFEAALNAVRTYGGVLEHPSGSHAWRRFHLPFPPREGWSQPDIFGGRSCWVDQGAYGHKAKKPTWLYAKLQRYPDLVWTRVRSMMRLEMGPRSKEAARNQRSDPRWKAAQRLSKKERTWTPVAFRDALVELVRRNA
jgi:hypothetical protein